MDDFVDSLLEYSGVEIIHDSSEEDEEYLEHYGRKGMRWYQHIFGERQDHAKYAEKGGSSKKKKSSAADIEKRKVAKQKAEEKIARRDARKNRKANKRRQAILSNPTALYKHRNEFSQEEINAAMKTFAWEQQLSNFSQQRINAGKNYMGMASQYLDNAIRIYNSVASVYNTFSPSAQVKRAKYIEQPNEKKNK